MNLTSSLRGFGTLLSEDVSMARLGAPRGWLLRMHYRGRWADRRRQAAPAESVTVQVRGRRLQLELSAAYEGAFKGIFLDDEYDCVPLLSEAPNRILDLGANIGLGTLYLSALFPESQFVCVEPDPRNLPLLERNLRLNSVKAIVKACAVGAVSGTLNLRFGDNPTCSALETSPMHALTEVTRVPVLAVSDLIQETGWDGVDLVKMDIEGTEEELLSKNNSWLASTRALMLEVHPNTTPARISTFLEPFDFKLRRIGWKAEPVYFASRTA